MHRRSTFKLALLGITPSFAARAQGSEPGISDTEIVIGGTAPFSGPASALSMVNKSAAAYFNKVNEEGGINGRKIRYLILDDGFTPPKTVEQTRKLVESDKVFFIFLPIGSGPSLAVRRYLNGKKVPQLFVMAGSAGFADPKQYPWSIAGLPAAIMEAKIFGKYIRENTASAKVGMLYQNDDYGKESLAGLREGLDDRASSMLASVHSYELTDPTVDSQLIALKAAGVDTLVLATTPKFGAQAIRGARSIDWRPQIFVSYGAASVSQVMQPSGAEAGIITSLSHRDPSDPLLQDDANFKEWVAFMDKYLPEGKKDDLFNVVGYNNAMGLVHILRNAGKTPTRDSILQQASNLDVQLPMMEPGVRLKTTPTDYFIMQSLRLARYDGKVFRAFGNVIDGAS